ncbi:MAG: LPS export ABC transporter periplasmic protein LptC [Gammaproteobacteria bacterium]|nr:LPS export ABC transporter periplasmic protein LptC [Gammaproteobacteria bacterium]
MGKLHYFTILLLIILFAIASGWIFESIENRPALTKEKLRHIPDYFLKNFTSTIMDQTGKPTYKIKAEHLEHYPDDDSMKLQKPVFSFYEKKVKTWTAQANEALILKDGEKIHLKGKVILSQILYSNKQTPMILTAKQLTIEPKQYLAHTTSKIKL